MIYGYARVSTEQQNLDRQLEELRKHVPSERCIITDKASGKDFNRRGYNSFVGTPQTAPMLREGDVLIVTSIDRLGRNYEEIKQQWDYIVNTLKADIKVLEMPLLDTTGKDTNLDRKFIADLVLQILSYVAEKERDFNKKRQRQGIDAMPVDERGVRYSTKKDKGKMGRPRAEFPTEWETIYKQWKAGEITATKAMEKLNLKHSTFYRLANRYEERSKT